MISIQESKEKIILYETYQEYGASLKDIIDVFSTEESINNFIDKLIESRDRVFKKEDKLWI